MTAFLPIATEWLVLRDSYLYAVLEDDRRARQ